MMTFTNSKDTTSNEQIGSFSIDGPTLYETGVTGINKYDHLYVGEHNFKLEVTWVYVQNNHSYINNPQLETRLFKVIITSVCS
jgi:hypothetical protein